MLGLSCGIRLFIAVRELLCSCGGWAYLPWNMWDLSSPTRDRTHIPCVGRQTPNPWTTREVLGWAVLNTARYALGLFSWPVSRGWCWKPGVAQSPLFFFFPLKNQSASGFLFFFLSLSVSLQGPVVFVCVNVCLSFRISNTLKCLEHSGSLYGQYMK